jgi:hypothetical protein
MLHVGSPGIYEDEHIYASGKIRRHGGTAAVTAAAAARGGDGWPNLTSENKDLNRKRVVNFVVRGGGGTPHNRIIEIYNCKRLVNIIIGGGGGNAATSHSRIIEIYNHQKLIKHYS